MSRLTLPNPQSRHRQDYYAVKSHLAAVRRLVTGVRVLRAPTLKNNLHALRVDRPDSRRRSRAPCLGIARKPSLLRGFGPARRKSNALSAGAENTFHPAFIGVGREIGISCPEKIGIRVDRRGELHDRRIARGRQLWYTSRRFPSDRGCSFRRTAKAVKAL